MRAAKAKTPQQHPDWSQLLVQAVTMPGILSDAYSRFWSFSVGNQVLAFVQCIQRGIAPGPLHTFLGWRDLGRHVKKGEKALTLCMPVTVRRSSREAPSDEANGHEDREAPTRTCFVYRPHWFVLSQTGGKEYVPVQLPQWSEARALEVLKIERVPFLHSDGNVQGYAAGRQIAVSPVAFMPPRTLLHELAHVTLGHCEEQQRLVDDDSATPRDVREVEAECVAMICCSSLGLGGESFSRGYVQSWLKGQSISERSAQKIFKAADQILRAGRADDPSDSSRSR